MSKRRELRALALPLVIAAAFVASSMPVFGQFDQREDVDRRWPDIKQPGLDLGDFPNSAFTLPAGTWQFEFAPFTILGEDEFSQPEYSSQFLLRFGLTDDVEFRILGNGLTVLYTEPQATGFSPVTLDMKVHLWDDKREWFLPASSLEVSLTTDWGSSEFSSGYQPTLNLNFDYPLTDSLNLEWTVGYGEALGTLDSRSQQGNPLTVDEIVNQVSFQWAFEKDLSEDFQAFVTGITSESVPGQSAGTTLAFGGFLRWSDRLMFFGLMGWGVTPDAPKIGAQLGMGIAMGKPRSK